MKELQAIDITKFLPHRPPFLMVDTILTLTETNVSTSFNIKEDCIFVENKLFTETGLIENAAQTCSSIVGKDFFEEGDLEGKSAKLIGFISAIKKVTIKKCPQQGDRIVTRAYLISRFDADGYSVCTLGCDSYCDEQELLSCEMNLFIQELK